MKIDRNRLSEGVGDPDSHGCGVRTDGQTKSVKRKFLKTDQLKVSYWYIAVNVEIAIVNYKQKTLESDYNQKFEEVFNLLDHD